MKSRIIENLRKVLKQSPAVLSVLGALASVLGIFVLLQSKLGISKELTYSIITLIIAFAIGVWSASIAKAVKKVSPKRVFISYPRSAEEIARTLAALIRERGYRVWLDEEQIKPGEKWETRIKDAIVDADVFVALLKIDYSQSGNVMFELGYAAGQEKLRIVPVLLDEMSAPSQLERFRFVEAYSDVSKGLEEVVRAID